MTIRDYVLKHYPNRFKKKTVFRDGKGKLIKTEIKDIEPIITEGEVCWYISNHKDASPLILSKKI